MGSDGTASVQSGTLKLNEINQVVGLWDYGQDTDQAETDYEETAGHRMNRTVIRKLS